MHDHKPRYEVFPSPRFVLHRIVDEKPQIVGHFDTREEAEAFAAEIRPLDE